MAGRDEDVSDKEILKEFEKTPDPFLSTKELAETFDFSKSGIRKRLYSLADEGLLDYKKVGNSPGFWITDHGRAYLEGDLDVED